MVVQENTAGLAPIMMRQWGCGLPKRAQPELQGAATLLPTSPAADVISALPVVLWCNRDDFPECCSIALRSGLMCLVRSPRRVKARSRRLAEAKSD